MLTWLAAWLLTKQLPGKLATLAVCHRAAAAWGRLLAGQAAATEDLLFPDRKIKIPGENMPILQKELFLVESCSDQARLTRAPSCPAGRTLWPGLNVQA